MTELFSNHQKKRLLVDLLLFISIFVVPWWLLVLFFLVAFFYFSLYVEFVVFSLLYFEIYGIDSPRIFGIHISIVIIALVIFIALEILSDYLIFDGR
jgi:hypothetical protein